jgi:3-keto-L-gulonate-6-phosphate decarboxylase
MGLAASERRRDTLRPLEITVAAPGEVTLDTVEEYARIGVDRLVVGPDSAEGSEPDRFIENFERNVLAHHPIGW